MELVLLAEPSQGPVNRKEDRIMTRNTNIPKVFIVHSLFIPHLLFTTGWESLLHLEDKNLHKLPSKIPL